MRGVLTVRNVRDQQARPRKDWTGKRATSFLS
jgi:hypothetical protein